MIRLLTGILVLSSVLAANAQNWVRINNRDAHPTQVLARFKKAPDRARLAKDGLVDLQRTYSHIPNLAVVKIKDQAALRAAVAADLDPAAALKKTIATMEATGLFAYVEPDYIQYADLTPTDARFVDGTLWGLRNTGQKQGKAGADINVIPAWDLSTGDTNMVVAVIDTGVNYRHQDLATQMWRNPNEIPNNGIDDDGNGIVDDVYGINAINDTGDPLDDQGHGSHCAGTIGAAANNAGGHVGVIWNVRIMALKFLGDFGGTTSDAIQCINYSISKKVKLTSNSWGGGGFEQSLYDAIAAARAQGQLFVAAAGNEFANNDLDPHYPASYDLDNIISVAALDRNDRLADFSNYGLRTVDIGAPGVEIYSCWFGRTNEYNTIDGTSMATPHVAGAAALVWSKDTNATFAEIKARLLQAATPIPSLSGKVSTGGRLNVFNSMGGQVDGILEISVAPPNNSFFGVGSQATVQIGVRDVFNVTNATVQGRLNGVSYNFLDNGVAPDTNAVDGIYTATVPMPQIAGTYVFGVNVQAPGKTSAHVDVSYDVLTLPKNDFFSQAAKIPPAGRMVQADNRLATPAPGAVPGDASYGPDLGEPLHAGVSNVRSLWWSWSTPTSTRVIIDTAGTSFDDDAVLGVYNGSIVSNLTEVASAKAVINGPNGTRAPFVKFQAQANITYWIAVAQSDLGTNSPGTVVLRVEPNGDIDTTPPVVRVSDPVSGSFIRAATNKITISGTAEDPLPNASGVASVQIKVNGDLLFHQVTGTTNWSEQITLAKGVNTIQVLARDRADNPSPIVTATYTYLTQELSNDLFGNSTTLLGASGVVTVTNTLATKEFGEPSHAGNEGGHSVWWNYRPSADGILVLSTEGSSLDTLLALYTVNDETVDRSVSSVTLVKSNDDQSPGVSFSELQATIERGRLYYIAVDGYGGQVGTIRLEYNFQAQQAFTVVNTTTAGGTVTPLGSTVFPIGSAVSVTAIPDRYMQFKNFQVSITNASTGEVTQQTVTSNPFTFEVRGGASTIAHFERKIFTDDFESGDFTRLTWQNNGVIYTNSGTGATFTNRWTVESVRTNTAGNPEAFSHVARANATNNSSVSLVLVTNLLAGTGSFEFRVSSETNYDKAEFLIDGRVVVSWSGELPWQLYTFEIPAKETATRLEWRYTKDFANTEGDDAFFIDNVDLPIAPPAPINLTVAANPPTLTVNGPPGAVLQLQTSTDLVNWSATGDERTANFSGVTVFTLPAFDGTQRYYRVRQL